MQPTRDPGVGVRRPPCRLASWPATGAAPRGDEAAGADAEQRDAQQPAAGAEVLPGPPAPAPALNAVALMSCSVIRVSTIADQRRRPRWRSRAPCCPVQTAAAPSSSDDDEQHVAQPAQVLASARPDAPVPGEQRARVGQGRVVSAAGRTRSAMVRASSPSTRPITTSGRPGRQPITRSTNSRVSAVSACDRAATHAGRRRGSGSRSNAVGAPKEWSMPRRRTRPAGVGEQRDDAARRTRERRRTTQPSQRSRRAIATNDADHEHEQRDPATASRRRSAPAAAMPDGLVDRVGQPCELAVVAERVVPVHQEVRREHDQQRRRSAAARPAGGRSGATTCQKVMARNTSTPMQQEQMIRTLRTARGRQAVVAPGALLRADHQGQHDGAAEAGQQRGRPAAGIVKRRFMPHAPAARRGCRSAGRPGPGSGPRRPRRRSTRCRSRLPPTHGAVGIRFSATPSSSPPIMAPRMLPMPPSTAAANALMPGMKPIVLVNDEGRAEQEAGRAGQRAADDERARDRLVDVDAHQRRGRARPRRSPRMPRPSLVPDTSRSRKSIISSADDDDDHLQQLDLRAEDREQHVVLVSK